MKQIFNKYLNMLKVMIIDTLKVMVIVVLHLIVTTVIFSYSTIIGVIVFVITVNIMSDIIQYILVEKD